MASEFRAGRFGIGGQQIALAIPHPRHAMARVEDHDIGFALGIEVAPLITFMGHTIAKCGLQLCLGGITQINDVVGQVTPDVGNKHLEGVGVAVGELNGGNATGVVLVADNDGDGVLVFSRQGGAQLQRQDGDQYREIESPYGSSSVHDVKYESGAAERQINRRER